MPAQAKFLRSRTSPALVLQRVWSGTVARGHAPCGAQAARRPGDHRGGSSQHHNGANEIDWTVGDQSWLRWLLKLCLAISCSGHLRNYCCTPCCPSHIWSANLPDPGCFLFRVPFSLFAGWCNTELLPNGAPTPPSKVSIVTPPRDAPRPRVEADTSLNLPALARRVCCAGSRQQLTSRIPMQPNAAHGELSRFASAFSRPH